MRSLLAAAIFLTFAGTASADIAQEYKALAEASQKYGEDRRREMEELQESLLNIELKLQSLQQKLTANADPKIKAQYDQLSQRRLDKQIEIREHGFETAKKNHEFSQERLILAARSLESVKGRRRSSGSSASLGTVKLSPEA